MCAPSRKPSWRRRVSAPAECRRGGEVSSAATPSLLIERCGFIINSNTLDKELFLSEKLSVE